MELVPLLVSGYGRSGTTALMSLLGTDPRVAMGRTYPFEDRYLTYISKLVVLLERNVVQPQPSPEQIYSFEDCVFGGFPWAPPGPAKNLAGEDGLPSAAEWFRQLWAVIVDKARSREASAAYYAEKAPAWVSAFVRRSLPARTFYLFRDPRDMYLSANAFMRQRQYFSFGRGPRDSDLDHARNLAYEFLLYFENFRADKERADCMLVQYTDLIQDRVELMDRLRRFAGLQCLPNAEAKDLESHRTSLSPEKSVDRWRREPLPQGVLSFLETYLQESMVELHYEPAAPGKIRQCPGVDYAQKTASFDRGGRDDTNENGLHVPFQNRPFSLDLPIDPFPSRQAAEIWVSLYGPAADQVSLSWQTPSDSARQRLSLPTYGGRHWRVLRFHVGRHERWQGTISKLRLEMSFNSVHSDADAVYLRWVRLVE
jgi:hypothetical protein